MSKLSDLRSKGEIVTLSNGLELNITPMSLGEEADVSELSNDKKTTAALILLVKNAVKRALPEAMDEEIDNLNKDDLKVITEVVLKINKLVDDKKKSDAN